MLIEKKRFLEKQAERDPGLTEAEIEDAMALLEGVDGTRMAEAAAGLLEGCPPEMADGMWEAVADAARAMGRRRRRPEGLPLFFMSCSKAQPST